ncbi:MAG: 5-oxoprolinase subunit PxpB [Pseudomonadales bacterium]|nr:5-oxoprolinase subunit PxpB [Gammaproteobacteria bacterium]NNL57737.1 5-oxoprolinase subunit PxpB [Pseudomonadales bacterium]
MNNHCTGAQLYHYGECAIVLELEHTNKNGKSTPMQAIWQLESTLRQLWHTNPAIRDIVPGDGNLTIVFEPLLASAAQISEQLQQRWQQLANTATQSNGDPATAQYPTQQLEVIYGGNYGPDLAGLAGLAGLTPKQLIELHCSTAYRVAFLGFQPGFAYLQGLDPRLQVARRSVPRQQVPANSLAIGGSYCGIYPAPSPGGWHIIGRYTKAQGPLFDLARTQPALLAPGASVRFVPAAASVDD